MQRLRIFCKCFFFLLSGQVRSSIGSFSRVWEHGGKSPLLGLNLRDTLPVYSSGRDLNEWRKELGGRGGPHAGHYRTSLNEITTRLDLLP